MPIGLASSFAYYQRLINENVANILHVFCYLDNNIVMTQDFKRILLTLMQRLREHGLILNRDKCVLAERSLMFLGHCVTSDGAAPAEAQLRSIRRTELP